MMQDEKKVVKIHPKLHTYDGEVVVYNPIEINLYKDYLELNIDFLFRSTEIFENNITGEEREVDLEEPLWVKALLDRSTVGLDTIIVSNVEVEDEKIYKEYTIQLRSLGNIYSFKLRTKSMMLDVYEILKNWKMGNFNSLGDSYEFGKV